MGDKTLTCGCGSEFAFTEGEQAFYEGRGFEAPKRCPECRAERKRAKEAEGSNY